MSEQLLTSVVTVITAIIGVAILAVLVSRQSNTTGVIKAASSGFAQDLQAALSPVTGGGGFGGIGSGLLNFQPLM
jgi:PRD1 phage membrane DNA delivery